MSHRQAAETSPTRYGPSAPSEDGSRGTYFAHPISFVDDRADEYKGSNTSSMEEQYRRKSAKTLPGSVQHNRKTESMDITSLSLNTHGMDQYEHALLLYTFGEPDKVVSPLNRIFKYTLAAVILAGLIWNPWVDKLMIKYIKNDIMRFVFKLIAFLILFMLIGRVIIR